MDSSLVPLLQVLRYLYLLVNVAALYQSCSDYIGKSYPDGMCEIPSTELLDECGFFPVTSGSFHEPSIHISVRRDLMFLGQDWGSIAAFEELKGKSNQHTDRNIGTGKALHELLISAKIPVECCFFTNALFGLRQGEASVGRSPGWSDPPYVARCKMALQAQIKAVQPRAIICLGRDAPELLVEIVEECKPWTKAETFKIIDEADQALITDAVIDGRAVDLALLVHPSYRGINAKYRSFRGKDGDPAEVELLREVYRRIGLT